MQRSLKALSAGVVVAGLVLFSSVAMAQGWRGPWPRSAARRKSGSAGASSGRCNFQRMLPPAQSPAEMLLRQREHLQLTDDQAKRLEALGKTQRDALKPQRANILRAAADLADAEDKDNFDSQRSALEKMAKIRIDRDIAHRKAMKDAARDVLTPEQRDR